MKVTRELSPSTALVETRTDKLLANARVFQERFDGPHLSIPQLKVAIVTCMDARIDPVRMFELKPGDAHVIRNAGGIVTDDVLRSLVLSQRIMQTNEVILIHHVYCGVHAAIEEGLSEAFSHDVGEPLPYKLGMFEDLDQAVRDAIERVKGHRFLPHRTNVRGFVYDVNDGSLREIHP